MNHPPKTLLGHVQCPECDFPDAEVKTDKAGHPYRYCPDCNAQTFTRGHAKRAKNMMAKMRPVGAAPAAPVPETPKPEQKPAGGQPAQTEAPKPAPVKRSSGLLLG